MWDLIIIYPKPYFIYFRGTISLGLAHAQACSTWLPLPGRAGAGKSSRAGLSGCSHIFGLRGFRGLGVGSVGFIGFIGFIGLIGFIEFIGFIGFLGFIGFMGFIGLRFRAGGLGVTKVGGPCQLLTTEFQDFGECS